MTNLVAGQVVAVDPSARGYAPGPTWRCGSPDAAARVGEAVTVLIRPEAARLADDCPDEAGWPIEGTVQSTAPFAGATTGWQSGTGPAWT